MKNIKKVKSQLNQQQDIIKNKNKKIIGISSQLNKETETINDTDDDMSHKPTIMVGNDRYRQKYKNSALSLTPA